MTQATKTAAQSLTSIAAEINHAVAEIRHAAWVLKSAANSTSLDRDALERIVLDAAETIAANAEKIAT